MPDPVLFDVDRFYYVVPAVEKLIADDLYQNPLLVFQPFHYYHRHILVLIASKHCAEHDVVHPAVAVVRYGNVVNPPVAVKVKVVDP